jgi:FixJ family two-component response regulator
MRAEGVVTGHENEIAVIVIVDDDPSVRRGLSRLMRACGLEVETYSSAEEFLESSNGKRASCLLLDVQMDGMSGLELVDVLTAEGEPPPIIIITAHASEAVSLQAVMRGTPVLRKPIESETLLTAVGSAIGQELRWND